MNGAPAVSAHLMCGPPAEGGGDGTVCHGGFAPVPFSADCRTTGRRFGAALDVPLSGKVKDCEWRAYA